MKKIVALALISLSINGYARMVAPGVELIYEKTTVTGENVISGEHIEEESGYFFFQSMLTAHTESYSGSVRQNILMKAHHYFSIVNQTQSKQQYQIRT